MKRILAVCVIAVGAVCVPAAQAEVVTNDTDVVQAFGDVPCANGGAGEDVSGTVRIHTLVTVTANGNHRSLNAHTQIQGGSLVGEVTGDRYRFSGSTHETGTLSLLNDQHVDTFVSNTRLIGPGPGNNLLIHIVEHFTSNANGDITVNFDRLRAECK
jgi:hypothetical protein